MLDVGWKPATSSLLADELGVIKISLNLQASTQILGWLGKINHSSQLAIRSSIGIEVPPELLEWVVL